MGISDIRCERIGDSFDLRLVHLSGVSKEFRLPTILGNGWLERNLEDFHKNILDKINLRKYLKELEVEDALWETL